MKALITEYHTDMAVHNIMIGGTYIATLSLSFSNWLVPGVIGMYFLVRLFKSLFTSTYHSSRQVLEQKG